MTLGVPSRHLAVSRPFRQRVRRLREPSFPAPFDRISDPQIPRTTLDFQSAVVTSDLACTHDFSLTSCD
jgi:hypothetical protein